jgi:hypothetical protein
VEHRGPTAGGGSWHRQIQSSGTPTLSRPSERRIGIPEFPSSSHSLGCKRVGNEDQIEAVPPTFPSFRMPDQSMGIRRPGGTRKTRKAADPTQDTPDRKSTPRRRLGNFHAYIAQVSFTNRHQITRNETEFPQLPETPIGARGRTHLLEVPQTRYKCPIRQDSWGGNASIEFGGIKLTDALNRAHPGPEGSGDKVLNYVGVGSTVSCRINVSRVSRVLQIR